MQRLYSVLAILLKGGILTGFGITPSCIQKGSIVSPSPPLASSSYAFKRNSVLHQSTPTCTNYPVAIRQYVQVEFWFGFRAVP